MREFAKGFYQSSQWRKCRNAYFQMKHGLCERCSETGKIVHHKKYLNESNINDVEITLSFDNLELLCQDCHNKEHNEKYGINVDGVKFNSNGELIKA